MILSISLPVYGKNSLAHVPCKVFFINFVRYACKIAPKQGNVVAVLLEQAPRLDV